MPEARRRNAMRTSVRVMPEIQSAGISGISRERERAVGTAGRRGCSPPRASGSREIPAVLAACRPALAGCCRPLAAVGLVLGPLREDGSPFFITGEADDA